jgi:HD-GYP domain-containing protein (c-di-GMP phosphodiesterase class II)
VKQLIIGSGTQFDSRIVDKFVNMLENFEEIEKELAYTYD